MKLLYETEIQGVEFAEEINESTGTKKYKIKGIFSSPGQKNKNGRVYSMGLWEKEVQKYQDVIKSGHSNSLLELNHPARTDVDMMEAVAKMNKLYIKDGYVMGEATLLDNPKANQLKTLIDNGIKMAVSSRGLGKVNNGLVEDFKLITFDIIPNLGQSDYNAEMHGIVEGVLEDKEFMITESGRIEEVQMCSDDSCHLFEVEDVKEATLEKFKQILDELKESKESDALAKEIDKAIVKIDDEMSYVDFAKAVAKILIDEYGKHNYKPFMDILKKELK